MHIPPYDHPAHDTDDVGSQGLLVAPESIGILCGQGHRNREGEEILEDLRPCVDDDGILPKVCERLPPPNLEVVTHEPEHA